MAKLKQSRIAWNFLGFEIVIFNNNFAWHFSSCDYSIPRANPGTLPHLRTEVWDKSERFLVFHLLLSQRDLSLMCQGPWIRLWTVTSLFCSISRLAVWCLLKKITKHASLLYLCIFQNVFEKARERSETESILWKLWDYRPPLASSEIQHIRFARILLKSLVAALRDKKQKQKQKQKKNI